ncbi:MAG: hypothetical protein Q9217_001306 [Psora testacea]
MALISSPVAYPPSSSPPQPVQRRKRSLNTELSYPSKRKSLVSNGIDTGNLQRPNPFAEADLFKENTYSAPKVPIRPRGPFLDDDDEDAGICSPVLASRQAQLDRDEESLGSGDVLRARKRDDTRGGLPRATTSSGTTLYMRQKARRTPASYEKLIAARSTTAPGKATKSFYGVNIHALIDKASKEKKIAKEVPLAEIKVPNSGFEGSALSKGTKNRMNMLWTEKYRARKFTDLVGDERTHRDVLRWLKHWDPVVFPGSAKPKPKRSLNGEEDGNKSHRKILMLSGPPGLGKTTLAHVCARQAGYEVVEINASDERTSQVVKGRIRDCVGTENVKGLNINTEKGKVRKAGRPVCVVVDEVDGVVSGTSGSGEGGFIKALVDLVALDQKNTAPSTSTTGNPVKSKKKGDKFRLLRPIILICNDVYHPSLRPLRASSMAEIIHIRKPPLDKVVARLKSVFEKECLPCDSDGVRRLCEAAWGVTSRREGQAQASGKGDMRGILVVGEWAASKLRASPEGPVRLTKTWVEENMTESLSHDGGSARGIGRGGAKEAVDRIFLDGAGFAKTPSLGLIGNVMDSKTDSAVGVAEAAKKIAMDGLREIIDTSGESDRIVTDCFAAYPTHPFQDDTFLSKPNAACDWLHFHDRLSSKVHVGQEWELGLYLSHSILGLHHLFSSPAKQPWSDQKSWPAEDAEEPLPFSGLRAYYSASEALKQNRAILYGLQSSLSMPLMRSFRSIEDLSTDLLPNLIKMLTPSVKPIVVGGSGEQAGIVSVRKEGERQMIERAVGVMDAVGVTFLKARVDAAAGGRSGVNSRSSHIFRMEPPLDSLATFETACQAPAAAAGSARFAIRQAMDQEYHKYILRKSAEARQARYQAGGGDQVDGLSRRRKDTLGADARTDAGNKKPLAVKRDFFGRVISEARPGSNDGSVTEAGGHASSGADNEGNVWVSFHEGFSNAVRKPITLEELMRGF